MGYFRFHTSRTSVQQINNPKPTAPVQQVKVKNSVFIGDSSVSPDEPNGTHNNDKESLKDKLEIPGLWRLFSKSDDGKALKIIWIVVFGLCSAMFAYQTVDRIQMILHVPKYAKVNLDVGLIKITKIVCKIRSQLSLLQILFQRLNIFVHFLISWRSRWIFHL